MLIVAATACSSGDSTKVFNAGGESAAESSSPGSSGAGANAAAVGATQTATPAAVPTDEATGEAGTDAGEPTPTPSPSASRTPVSEPTASAPAEEPEPPLRLARPVRPRPREVTVIQPDDTSDDDPVIAGPPPATAVPGDGYERVPPSAQAPSPRQRPSRPPSGPRDTQESQGTQGTQGTQDAQGTAAAAGWGDPILVENFDGSRVDESRWSVYHSPNASSNPRTAAATSVGGGTLRLTGGFYGGKDLSGGVASTLTQQYGRWEVRMRAEKGAGYSAVALLWPERQGDPEYAEVDFAEIGDPSRQTGGIYIHKGEQEQAQSEMRADFTQWHTVAVDWLPDRLTFWLDGKQVWNYTGSRIPRSQPMGLTLQNDVVCDRWAPCRNASTPDTVTMYVDWVRIYRAPQR